MQIAPAYATTLPMYVPRQLSELESRGQNAKNEEQHLTNLSTWPFPFGASASQQPAEYGQPIKVEVPLIKAEEKGDVFNSESKQNILEDFY
jgi:hypothetical protein